MSAVGSLSGEFESRPLLLTSLKVGIGTGLRIVLIMRRCLCGVSVVRQLRYGSGMPVAIRTKLKWLVSGPNVEGLPSVMMLRVFSLSVLWCPDLEEANVAML